jgi:predicted nucleic acid-binding protein
LRAAVDSSEQIAMTAINVFEILKRVTPATRKHCFLLVKCVRKVLKGLKYRNNLSKERAFIQFLDDTPIFTLDDIAIAEAAEIYAESRKDGHIFGDADILTAAIVIYNNGTLASNNAKHYQHIRNLRLINRTE